MPKYRPYSCTITSAATFDAPKIECVVWSMLIVSSMPFSAYGPLAHSQRVSFSTSGRRFGVSPYTLFVEVKMKVASGAHCRVASSRFSVPCAFTPKSVNGSRAAQSCDGCAAVCTTRSTVPAASNAWRTAAKSRMSAEIAVNESGSAFFSSSTAHFVEASGPKKYSRRLLSTPITRNPCRPKCNAVSEPTNPPEPVTRIVFIRRRLCHKPPEMSRADFPNGPFWPRLPGMETLLSQIAAALLARKQTLATAESCTGGLVGGALTSLPGSSAWYLGGIVAYSNALKARLLGIAPDLLGTHGAVSPEIARAMAEGACAATRADVAVALTGIAGPAGGTPEKPVGLVYIAVAAPHGTATFQHHFPGSRAEIRNAAVETALRHLLDAVAS